MIPKKFNLRWIEREVKFKDDGVKVTVKFKRSAPYGRRQSTYRNVTEIHKNYNNTGRIAFESDIARSGLNQELKYIESIKLTPEKKRKKYRY
jgi:hypothetical protein